jgi:hypothetical protein
MGLNSVYQAAATDSCKVAVLPFDLLAWIEAPLNSHSQRGLRSVMLGCANLTPSAADCQYQGVLGNSAAVQMNFDLARYSDRSIVQRAALAVHVENNASFFTKYSQLRGRLLVGDQYQSLGGNVLPPPGESGWVLFDVTAFAARAINERRSSATFEISLPCGRSEAELTSFSLLNNEPKLIVEFR